MSATGHEVEVTPWHEHTPEQQAAIDSRARDVFTEAGAGTGKTGVLVERYCDAVTEDGVAPEAILAFTFTERAAGELRERIHRELAARARAAAEAGQPERAAELARAAREGERAWVNTIHGFCRRLLAVHPVAARMDPRFRVLDEVEAGRLSERAFAAALDEVVAVDEAATRFAAGFSLPRLRELVRGVHERLRSQGVERVRLPDPGPPARSVKEEGETSKLTPAEAGIAADGFRTLGSLLTAYDRRYEELKAERSGADFEDLELRALALLRAPGAIREAWRGRFEHLLVDEFQDTNSVQLALIDALRGPGTRLFTVGDEFQSIYRFRHADLDVFRARRREAIAAPRTDERPLVGNFRSRPDVLAAINFAGAALLEGFAPLEAGLEAEAKAGGGPTVELLLTDASNDSARKSTGWWGEEMDLDPPSSERSPAYVAEARFLAQRLRQLADGGVPPGDMVVLLRAFTHVDAYEEALDRAGLAPYVVGGRGYWSQQQVEDALRLLGAVANPLDDEVLFGALASPASGVSPDALWLLRQAARTQDGLAHHVWPTVERGEWPAETPHEDVRRLEGFRATIARLRNEAPLLPLEVLVDRTISAFDYDLALLSRPGGRRRMANLRKLMRLAREYEEHEGRDLRGFLRFAEERTQRDEREGMAAIQVEGHDGVRVMTVHAAKGLQFPVVAVADLGRALGAGSRDDDFAIGRIEDAGGDPSQARFGLRVPVAAGELLRLWEYVELCREGRGAEVEEACRLVYVAVSRAEERLILSGIFKAADLEPAEERSASDSALGLMLPALRARGWDGGEGEVSLERAEAIGGGVAAGPAPRISVRIQAPSAERAARLRERSPAAALPMDGAPERAPAEPLLAGFRPVAAVGHLSYSALADYAGCHYRFYVERVIGLEERFTAAPGTEDADDSVVPRGDELVAPQLGGRERALAIGNAVHAALEASARRSWDEPREAELAALCGRQGLAGDMEALERVQALVGGWLGCALRAQLDAAGARLRPEVPFVLALGGAVVRGKIDLVAETPQGLVIVDYKTDALRGSDPAEVAGRYSTQRDLYALAVHDGLPGSRAGSLRAAYCFLESPKQTLIESYDKPALSAARERLEAHLMGIGEGHFARTEHPHPSLCYGCPAAAHLCGKPAWRPQWASS